MNLEALKADLTGCAEDLSVVSLSPFLMRLLRLDPRFSSVPSGPAVEDFNDLVLRQILLD